MVAETDSTPDAKRCTVELEVAIEWRCCDGRAERDVEESWRRKELAAGTREKRLDRRESPGKDVNEDERCNGEDEGFPAADDW